MSGQISKVEMSVIVRSNAAWLTTSVVFPVSQELA